MSTNITMLLQYQLIIHFILLLFQNQIIRFGISLIYKLLFKHNLICKFLHIIGLLLWLEIIINSLLLQILIMFLLSLYIVLIQVKTKYFGILVMEHNLMMHILHIKQVILLNILIMFKLQLEFKFKLKMLVIYILKLLVLSLLSH